jgi:four helix bundle protein
MAIHSHKDLVVWQKAMQLAELCYVLTSQFPITEKYRLTDQLLRAAISVPANIAEGDARSSRRDYARMLWIARGSLAEAETHILLATRVGHASLDACKPALDLIDEISRMLNALVARLTKPEATS